MHTNTIAYICTCVSQAASRVILAVMLGTFAAERGPEYGTCQYNGRLYEYGESRIEYQGTACYKHKCFRSIWEFDKLGCSIDGNCHFRDDHVVINCSVFACTWHSDIYRYTFDKIGESCCPWDGTNYTDGEIHPNLMYHNCTRWRCSYGAWVKDRQDCQTDEGRCQGEGSSYTKNICEMHFCRRRPDNTLAFVFEAQSYCCYRGVRYQDGQIFTPPGQSRCVKYRCSGGELTTQQEGCLIDGRCRPIDYAYTEDCLTWQCSMRSWTNGTLRYWPIIIRARCRDINGNCHEDQTPNITTRFAQGCTCNVWSNERVTYTCP